MTRKPWDVFDTEDWRYLTQLKVEGQWFERKAHPPGRTPSGLDNFKSGKMANTICGFANSNPDVGGLLVIGIGDKGEGYGIDRFGSEYVNNLLSFTDYLDGSIPQCKLVEFTREDGSIDHLIFIYTPFLERWVARTSDGQCHIRRGDRTITLPPKQAQDLSYQKGELNFEDEPAVILDKADLESGIVNEFLERYIQQRRVSGYPSLEDVLRLARLTVRKNEQTWLTKGGLLVFHKDPRRIIPGAYVRYFRYEGKNQQSSLIRDEQFEGAIPTIIHKFREFIPTQLSRFSFRSEEGTLTSEDEYPKASWDEAIVNAIVHRSYSQQTRPVWIAHYDDRLEIISPGSYPLGVTPDNLIHTPRNTNLMEALRYLDFVQMAEEGTKTMRRVMLEARLPPPLYSPPNLDRVTCILFNKIDERNKARIDFTTRAKISPTTVVSNIFPLRIQAPLFGDPDAPFSEEPGRPTFRQIRTALLDAFRQAGFRVDSFTEASAVDFAEEYVVPGLAESKLAAIYPGLEFRLLELERLFYLVVDHTVQVRNRATVSQIQRTLPWLRLDNRRKCFIRVDRQWAVGYLIEVRNNSCLVELRSTSESSPQTVQVDANAVIPNLSTNVELLALLKAEGVKVNLVQEVRRASLTSVENAPRQRFDQIQKIVDKLVRKVFPLVINSHEVQISTTPLELNQAPLFLGKRISDPKVQFDSKGLRQEEDILRGLTTFGSFQKPQEEIPLVTICPASWAARMQAFIKRLEQGHQRYRGIETTFGVRFGTVTTVIAEVYEYEKKISEIIARIPRNSQPIFIVFTPEKETSRADYNSPYYRVKQLLLEAGYSSQMLKEETLENPQWKDLNFALDVFAKAGYVPWVLGEGMPNADLFVGLSSSVINYNDRRQKVAGYVNVFDDFGRWLFYDTASEAVPYEARNTMFANLLSTISQEYQAKRRKLQRVHIHHNAKLKHEDRTRIAQGILNHASVAEITFVYINQNHTFRLFDSSPKGDGTGERGTWAILDPNRFLIATTGRNSVGQKYVGTPRPLEVKVNRVQARGELDLAIYAQHILSLTRLNWASTKSFCHMPITIKFANDIAYSMNVFLANKPNFRLNDRLISTPWFL